MHKPLEIPIFLTPPPKLSREELKAMRLALDQKACEAVLEALGEKPRSCPDLVKSLGLTLREANRAINTLEQRGLIEMYTPKSFRCPSTYSLAGHGATVTGTIYNNLSDMKEAVQKSIGRYLPKHTDLHRAFYGGLQ